MSLTAPMEEEEEGASLRGGLRCHSSVKSYPVNNAPSIYVRGRGHKKLFDEFHQKSSAICHRNTSKINPNTHFTHTHTHFRAPCLIIQSELRAQQFCSDF